MCSQPQCGSGVPVDSSVDVEPPVEAVDDPESPPLVPPVELVEDPGEVLLVTSVLPVVVADVPDPPPPPPLPPQPATHSPATTTLAALLPATLLMPCRF